MLEFPTSTEIGAFALIAISMSNKLLKRLPEIAAKGRQEAEHILEGLDTSCRPRLKTCEWVLPVKDSAILTWIKANDRRRRCNAQAEVQQNLLICGDSLPVMAALLGGDEGMPSLRGKIDLIHISPPFDDRRVSPAAYPDQWAENIAQYLATITPRLILMEELLSNSGSIYLRVDWDAGHYAKVMIDEIFGRQRMGVLEWPGQGMLLIKPGKILDEKFYRTLYCKAQKPLSLLEKIILTSTGPESIVADFFGGAGNTAAVAERLGRHWITSERCKPACMNIRRRLLDQDAEPFLYQLVATAYGDKAPRLAM